MKVVKEKSKIVQCGSVTVEQLPEARLAGVNGRASATRRWNLRLSVHVPGVLNITDRPLFVVRTDGADGEPYLADPPVHLLDASLESLKYAETAVALVDETMANLVQAIGKTLKIPPQSVRLSQAFDEEVRRIKQEVASVH